VADHDTTPNDTTPNDTTQQPAQTRAPRRGRHDTDVTSLVFGLLFLGLAVVWALVEVDVVSWPDASGFFPVLLVVAGLVGLLSSVRRSRRSRRDDEQEVRS
jgi:fatty acid desaturase